jgi:hypothetical protein
VQHREALVLNALETILGDVLLNKVKVSLVGADGVSEVILVDGLLWVAYEGVDGLDAAGGLEVLVLDLRVKQRDQSIVAVDFERLQDFYEDLFEAFHVPVLVDGRVDDVRSEHVLALLRQKINQIVHRVKCIWVAQVLVAESGEKLLKEQIECGANCLTKFLVLAGVECTVLGLVGKGAAD